MLKITDLTIKASHQDLIIGNSCSSRVSLKKLSKTNYIYKIIQKKRLYQ